MRCASALEGSNPSVGIRTRQVCEGGKAAVWVCARERVCVRECMNVCMLVFGSQ